VQPIIPGEGIWNVTTRIGIVLDQLLCGGSTLCDVLIHQSDIGNGGTFTITGSNTYYCLAQSVTFNTGSAITINANNVTLDLNGHVIDGGRNTTNGITLGNGVRNVIIKNGTIQNIGGTTAGSNGSAITDAAVITTQLQNITIKDMNFNNNSQSMISMQKNFASLDVNELLIENCHANSSGGIAILGGAIVVQGCEINFLLKSSMTLSYAIELIAITSSRYCLVEDCILTGSFTTGAGMALVGHRNAIVRNCIMEGSLVGGSLVAGVQGVAIAIQECKNATISDCIAQSGIVVTSGTAGFLVDLLDGNRAVIERCVASQYALGFLVRSFGFVDSLRFTDCVAENNREAGFLYATFTNLPPVSNISFKRCCATANGIGFGIVTGVFSSVLNQDLSHVLFEDCVAQDNLGDGFSLVNEKANGTIRDVVFRNCVAQRNQGGGPYFSVLQGAGSVLPTTFRGDGFSLGTATFAGTAGPIRDVIFIDCVSQNNAHDGFAFASTTTKVKILNCLAMKNTGTGINNMAGNANYILGNSSMLNSLGDYFGQTDPNKIAANGNPGALLGAGRWVNAKT
jgi:hypothetical protein